MGTEGGGGYTAPRCMRSRGALRKAKGALPRIPPRLEKRASWGLLCGPSFSFSKEDPGAA